MYRSTMLHRAHEVRSTPLLTPLLSSMLNILGICNCTCCSVGLQARCTTVVFPTHELVLGVGPIPNRAPFVSAELRGEPLISVDGFRSNIEHRAVFAVQNASGNRRTNNYRTPGRPRVTGGRITPTPSSGKISAHARLRLLVNRQMAFYGTSD